MPDFLSFEARSAGHVGPISQAPPGSRADPLRATTESSSTPMQPGTSTRQDELRSNALAYALSGFVLNPAKAGPLIISVEGQWGRGRAIFMATFEQHLRERSAAKRANGMKEKVPVITKFNPSRQDKNELLWAAFAGHLTKQIIREQNVVERLKGHVRVFLSPFGWRRRWLTTLKTGIIFLIGSGLVFSLLVLPAHSTKSWLLRSAKTVHMSGMEKGRSEQKELHTSPQRAAAAAIATAVKPEQNASSRNVKAVASVARLWALWFFEAFALCLIGAELIGSRFGMLFSTAPAANLSKRMQSAKPDRGSSVPKACSSRLKRVVEAYARDKVIVVFIEDLNRCAIPLVMELIQAINLLISAELKNIVFVMGMETIAAGFRVEHTDALSQLRNRARWMSIVF